MKFLIKLFSFFAISFLIINVALETRVCSIVGDEKKSISYLVLGFDSAPANTDVMMIVSYDVDNNTLRAVQIPRDTYFDYDEVKSGKINGLYSYEIKKGASHSQALKNVNDKISLALGIKTDGYIAITEEGFSDTVDFLGGVDIPKSKIPSEIGISGSAENGYLHLDGNKALDLVRYRKEYKRGDLERLDVQKSFTRALLEKITQRKENISLIKFVSEHNGITFEIDKFRSASFFLVNAFKINDADFQIATLPGKAFNIDGSSYYVLNRADANSLISGYFPYGRGKFDPQMQFVNENNKKISEHYFSEINNINKNNRNGC